MPATTRVAGGGVAGLAVAHELARQGLAVEVFERREDVGGRFHQGWQILENGSSDLDALEELEALGLAGALPQIPVSRALFLDGFGGRWQVASDRPFAYFVRRGGGADTLDGALRDLAVAAGAVLHHGQEAPGGCDIVATGPRQADGIAREVVFATDLADTVAVLFDPRVTPTGYAYLFCLDGWATFGVAQVRRRRHLRAAQGVAWERFRSVLGPFAVRHEHEGGQLMNFFVPRRIRDAEGRWYVGEAAGVQDFLFGLGNRLALRSAGLVASGVLGSWDEHRFRAAVMRPMRTTIALRFAYERLTRRGFVAFCRAASRRDFRGWLVSLQRPSPFKSAMARVVMAAWRERRGCRHGPLCGWCRRAEG